ncbi:MAG: glycosyltransferase family 2 protein [Merismopedia sp. SIO2A8]|nr:glycosyltransferase family 2 protein [Merismopedia sp. SIO2A8]
MDQVGLVAIGRNEGDRLKQCLNSVRQHLAYIVYVDSGSTDGSVEFAQSIGVEVVSLDLSIPFTAARARNAGFQRLLELNPALEFVQFVDGDCEVVDGWLETAYQALMDHREDQWAVVCGRRREKFPHHSIYNLLCDLEWDTPIGEAGACGGDSLMRVEALQQVDGFNPTLIAGEEPELCVRLRQNGWKIWRLDHEMTRHDAQMMEFGQWWKRTRRAGHAFAEGAAMHGKSEQRHWLKETRSIWLWGVAIPLSAFITVGLTQGLSLLLLLAYPVSLAKIVVRSRSAMGTKAALLYGLSCVLGKFPQAQGAVQFQWNRWTGKHSTLIEYKA